MALRKNAKVELLKRVPLFAQCSKAELERIAAVADEIDLPEGRELTREGASGREFFVILEGEAEVTKAGRPLRTLGAGDFFGEIALVEHMPRTATVTATTSLRFFVLTSEAFYGVLDKNPEVERRVLRALARRLVNVAPDATV